jgi:hypothetical protein
LQQPEHKEISMARKTPTTPPTDPNLNGVPWDDGPAPAATGNDLDIFGGAAGDVVAFDPAELQVGLTNLVGSISAAGGIGGGASWLTLNQDDGTWMYGADRTETEPNAEWVLDTRTLKHGFVSWNERKVTERMVSVFQPAPDPTMLPPAVKPYEAAFSVEMRCLSGQDKGTKVVYKTNSYGGRAAFGKLVEYLAPRVRAQLASVFPVVLLRNSSYSNSQYNKRIFNPVFHVVRWLDVQGRPDGGAPVAAAATPPPAGPAAAAAQPGVRRRRVDA